jgi:uncharacterized protein with HEPN domain
MADRNPGVHLHDIVNAIDHIQSKLEGITLTEFEADLDRRRIVERSFEIISEASRRLPVELKLDHPEIPWRKVAGIGNILRHDYENVIPDALWKFAQDDLPTLEAVCRTEMKIIQEHGIEQPGRTGPEPSRSGRSR